MYYRFIQVTSASSGGVSALIIVAIVVGATASFLLVVVITVAIVIAWCCLSRLKLYTNRETAAPTPPVSVSAVEAPQQNENPGATSIVQTRSSYYSEVQTDCLYFGEAIPPALHHPIIMPISENYEQPVKGPLADIPANSLIIVPIQSPSSLEINAQEPIYEPEDGHHEFFGGGDVSFYAAGEGPSEATNQNEGMYEEAGGIGQIFFENPTEERLYQLAGVGEHSLA